MVIEYANFTPLFLHILLCLYTIHEHSSFLLILRDL